jgi:hypothetical protein
MQNQKKKKNNFIQNLESVTKTNSLLPSLNRCINNPSREKILFSMEQNINVNLFTLLNINAWYKKMFKVLLVIGKFLIKNFMIFCYMNELKR